MSVVLRSRTLALSSVLSGLALTLACGGGNSFCSKLEESITPTAAYADATIMAGNALTVKPAVASLGAIASATLLSGGLPPGMTLQSDGTLSGTPTALGTYTASIRLCNAAGGCTVVTDAITVTPGTLYAPETTTVGTALVLNPSAVGEAILSAEVVSGQLPDGMTLLADGSISGTPSVPGIFTASIRTCTAHGCSTGTSVITVNSTTATPLAGGYPDVTGPISQSMSTQPTMLSGGVVSSATLATGTLPSGMTLNADGSITGIPTESGSFPLWVTLGNASGGKLTVPVTLTVTQAGATTLDAVYTPATTPVGTALSVSPAATAGAPVAAAALVGGTLPPGMSLNASTGVLAGTPTTAGTFTALITLRNASGGAITRSAEITVTLGTQALDVSYTDAVAPVGSYVSVAPTVNSGGPVSSASLVSGSLPPGLTLGSDGTLSGVPTAMGSYTLQVQLCNASNGCETVPVTLTITLAAPKLSYASPTTTVGSELTLSPLHSGGTLVAPVTLASGTLPDGMSLDPSTGILSGTPSVAGVYPITLQACNAAGCSVAPTVITVNAASSQPLSASYLNASGVVNSALSTGPSLSGGGPVSSAVLVGGTLPQGMGLDAATGLISGIPTQSGAFPLQVALGNASGGKITVPVTLTVSSATGLSLDASYTNAATPVNTALTVAPVVTVGGPLSSATLVSGTLPPGMALDPVTGSITGKPTATGTYAASISLGNASGVLTTVPVVITVNSGTQALSASYTDAVALVNSLLSVSPSLGSGGPISGATLLSGSLPPGMSLASNGTISGTPTVKGTYTLLIQLCNGSGGCTTQPLTITIDALSLHYTTPVTYLTCGEIAANLPSPSVSSLLTYTLAGTLPSGLVLNQDGSITGTPTAETSGAVTVEVTAMAGNGATASQSIVISVLAAPTASLAANPSTVPVGQSSSLTVLFTGSADGKAILSGGNLSGALTVSSGVSIPTGIEASPTSQVYTLTVTNAAGVTVTRTATVQWITAPSDTWSKAISSGGGTYTPDSSNPLYGQISIAVPSGASCDQVTLTVNKEASLPGTLASSARNYSTTFNLTSSVGYPFKVPVTVTLAYDPTLSSPNLVASDLPMPFYWDPSYNRWVSTGFKSIDTTNHTVTFTTLLPGRYAVLGVPGLAASTQSTDFASGTDDWRQGNPSFYTLPGGASLGMGSFAAWYLPFRKAQTNATGLYNEFPTLGDANAAALISRLGNGTTESWNQVWNQNAYALSDLQTGHALLSSLIITGQPQMFLMGDARPAVDNALATVVYGYDASTHKFQVMDPNYPGSALKIAWDPSAGAFSAYDRAAAYVPAFTTFAFEGQTSVHRLADYERVFTGAVEGYASGTYASIALSQIGDVISPDTSATVAVADETSVTITGTVTNGDETAKGIFWTQNGNAPRNLATLDASGHFSFTTPLADPYGTTFTLETTSNPCDPTFSHSGYTTFKVKKTGILPWFANSCFEDAYTDPAAPNGWTVEYGLNKAGYTVASTPVVDTSTHELTGQGITWGAGLDSRVIAVTNQSALETELGNDPKIAAITKILGGNQSFRVNGTTPYWHSGRVHQDVTVPSFVIRPVISFYWAAVLEDPRHAANEQPYVDVLIQDVSDGYSLVLYKHFYAGDPSYPGWINASGAAAATADLIKGIPWQRVQYSIPTARKGHTFRVMVTAAGCQPSGHFGYAYLDNLSCE